MPQNRRGGNPRVGVRDGEARSARSRSRAAFVLWERRTANPMVPLRLFRSRAFAAGNAVTFCLFATLLALVFFMAQLLQSGLGYGPLSTGVRLLPGWAALTLIAPFSGRLIGRVGERPLITGGLTVVTGGLIWMALIAKAGPARRRRGPGHTQANRPGGSAASDTTGAIAPRATQCPWVIPDTRILADP